MNITIIDSGISFTANSDYIKNINGISIIKSTNRYEYYNSYTDNIGHGTSVANIIIENVNTDINLFIIKIIDSTYTIDIDLLIEALRYCDKHLKSDIIQISMGSLYSNMNLKKAVEKLTKNGTVIVSAFDNEKCISYPAAYEEVIGVDVTQQYSNINQYDITENNVVDIRGADIYHRAMGLDKKKVIVKGSSFYCSYITSLIINMKLDKADKNIYLDALKLNAEKIFECSSLASKNLSIKKAIIFPFNKEVHSIAAFERLLSFDIAGYYDLRQKGLMNRQISDILTYTNNNKVIYDFNEINWNGDFDTFICGHINEIQKILKYDIMKEIIEKTSVYEKQLICFDNITEYIYDLPNLNVYFPFMDRRSVPKYRFGKLRSPNTPIIGVFGTSSQQGKMTVQLMLRESLKKRNIKVKNIGSEPESILFGFENSYVFGYNATDLLQSDEMIQVLNEAVYNLEKSECDIIIAGSQSGTVPHQLRNINMIPLKQYSFLLGVQPDSIILCINNYDSVEYIKRTIAMFKAVVNADVICIVMSSVNQKKSNIEVKTPNYFEEVFNIPVFDLYSLDNLNSEKMVDIILKYYEV